jgi:hypothetical protein
VSGFKKNFSPEYRETHYRNLINMFTREVHIVTERRDGCVWKTKQVGEVVSFGKDLPFRPGAGAQLVARSR